MAEYDKELAHELGFNGIRLSPVDQIWYEFRTNDDYAPHILLDKWKQPTVDDEGDVGLAVLPRSDPLDLAGETVQGLDNSVPVE